MSSFVTALAAAYMERYGTAPSLMLLKEWKKLEDDASWS